MSLYTQFGTIRNIEEDKGKKYDTSCTLRVTMKVISEKLNMFYEVILLSKELFEIWNTLTITYKGYIKVKKNQLSLFT